MKKLPKDFIFGGATAAYQCEGATKEDDKGLVCWDVFYEKTNGYNPDPASDFYHKYKEDIDNCVKFGVNGIRLSISWARIFPNGYGEVNQKGVEHYHNLFKYSIENGVEPLVTLHHFDTPYLFNDNGDFTNPEVIEHFIEYAKFCLNEFKEIKKWASFNEIWPWASGQFITGVFPPGEKYRYDKAVKCMDGMLYAHARILNYFCDQKFDGEMGVIHSLETCYGIDDKPKNIEASKRYDALANSFNIESTLLGTYSKKTVDRINFILRSNSFDKFVPSQKYLSEMKKSKGKIGFVGINYYQSHWFEHYEGENKHIHNGTGEVGKFSSSLRGLGKEIKRDDIPKTDWDWAIYPKGLYDMIMRLSELETCKKIYITENGIGIKEQLNENNTVEDDARINYIKEHLKAVVSANENGANVKGYYLWSLMDMFSWSNGYNKRYGLFFVDFDSLERYPKKSAYWYKELSKSHILK